MKMYCCATDWKYELSQVSDLEGKAPLYSSIEKLKEKSHCWEECGIVEITLEATLIEKGSEPWAKSSV